MEMGTVMGMMMMMMMMMMVGIGKDPTRMRWR
jgi:hypothetical protein